MTGVARELERLLADAERLVVVRVADAEGSTPRAAGAVMAVGAERILGSIGGGQLEWQAMQQAREMLTAGEAAREVALPLGPAIGQCCGGRVRLDLRLADAAVMAEVAEAEARERAETPQVVVCGNGHVGQALVRALAPLPVRILWADQRADAFPAELPANVEIGRGVPTDAVGRAEPGAAVAVMTHSHALDYEVTRAALMRRDLAYVGLIGSATKRQRFERWFRARGGDERALARLVSPIGDFGVDDKRPAVIAAFAAAELLQALARARAAAEPPEAAR